MGLPVEKEDFYASREKPTSEYTKRFWHWPEYRREFVDDYEPLRTLLVGLSVKMIENASFQDFAAVWHEDVDAVVLFSHWAEDGIEFRDGRVGSLAIAGSIPAATSATLDLCVCHPQNLVLSLEESHPFLIKKAVWVLADPKYWCLFYRALFKYLADNDSSYPDALDKITSLFLGNGAKEKRH